MKYFMLCFGSEYCGITYFIILFHSFWSHKFQNCNWMTCLHYMVLNINLKVCLYSAQQTLVHPWASLHLAITLRNGKATKPCKQYLRHIWHINRHIRHNLRIPFGYQPYQVWSAIDTPGRLIPSLTHGRTTHARRSPIQVLTHLIVAYLPQVVLQAFYLLAIGTR